jgi:hypothetical protein
LNPQKLKNDQRNAILDLYEKIKRIEFPSILEQLRTRFSARVELDMAILKVLGYSEDEAKQFLDYLYPALANEIQQLKTLMEG